MDEVKKQIFKEDLEKLKESVEKYGINKRLVALYITNGMTFEQLCNAITFKGGL